MLHITPRRENGSAEGLLPARHYRPMDVFFAVPVCLWARFVCGGHSHSDSVTRAINLIKFVHLCDWLCVVVWVLLIVLRNWIMVQVTDTERRTTCFSSNLWVLHKIELFKGVLHAVMVNDALPVHKFRWTKMWSFAIMTDNEQNA